jgi:hypothetical protein
VPLESEALNEFDRALMKAIDGTISALLSPSVLGALYEHLAQHHSITSNELPGRLETLRAVLRQTIGFSASRTVERAIAKTLYSNLKIRFNSNTSQTLVDYVEEAKKLTSEESRSRP